MNLPNKLTIFRVVLIPLFLVFLFIDKIPGNYFLALAIFAIASITDALDGHIARKNNLVTNFGKFLDPLADKVLVMSALVAFIELGLASSIAVIIILAREFMVTSLRLVANKEGGKVIAAGMLGKLKTAFTMVAIVAILFLKGLAGCIDISFNLGLIYDILIWIATAITAISGIQYLWQYRTEIDPTK
jgi:CDP-diacylglycerol--glycerol-3-phosphate 3-phosphatidyltransferase